MQNHGEEELVTIWNLEEYLHLLSELILNVGIRRQMDAFFSGFEALAPVEMLRCFSVLELDELFSGSRVLFSRQGSFLTVFQFLPLHLSVVSTPSDP